MLREVGAVDGVSHALHGGEAAEGEDGRLEPICGEGGSNGGRAFAGWGSDVQTHPADDPPPEDDVSQTLPSSLDGYTPTCFRGT